MHVSVTIADLNEIGVESAAGSVESLNDQHQNSQ
ncbi:MAG: hypothetical protein ACJA14_001911 [Ilumatobacter sp.]